MQITFPVILQFIDTYLYNTVYGASFTYIFQYRANYSRNLILSNKNCSKLGFFMDHWNITVDPQYVIFCMWTPEILHGNRLRKSVVDGLSKLCKDFAICLSNLNKFFTRDNKYFNPLGVLIMKMKMKMCDF